MKRTFLLLCLSVGLSISFQPLILAKMPEAKTPTLFNKDKTNKMLRQTSTGIIDPIILKTLGAFTIGILIATQLRKPITKLREKQKGLKENTTQPIEFSNLSEQEIYNIVTNYGEYPEVWDIYRGHGWLEAIKHRDEKAEFDNKLGKINNNPSTSKIGQENPINQTTDQLDELDLALVKSLVSYFEKMSDKIRHYHQDHQASIEEAEIIAKYYQNTAKLVETVQTKQDAKNLIKHIEDLKGKVKRYQHESFKYRWSTSLQKEVLDKLEKINLH